MSEFMDLATLQSVYAEVVTELRNANETIGKYTDKVMELAERNYLLDQKARALEAELEKTKHALACEQDYPSKLRSPKDEYDRRSSLQVFWRHENPKKYKTVWSVMRDDLHLCIELSRVHMKRRGVKCSPYVDSEEWSYYREGNSLYVHVQVGSTSDHDCDGSLCHLSYLITPFEDFILVQEYRGYNY